jgi:hypothetical protein
MIFYSQDRRPSKERGFQEIQRSRHFGLEDSAVHPAGDYQRGVSGYPQASMGGGMNSYLSDADVRAILDAGLHKRTPYLIRGVSQTQLSIARHYGGINYNGDSFTYMPTTDELVRDDVVEFIEKGKRKAKQAERKEKRRRGQEMVVELYTKGQGDA